MASLRKEFENLEIQLEEIKSATNNFDEKNVIGHGGFGKVYKGELRKSMVALKRLDRRHGQGDTEFYKEVRMLSCYRHENIISLLGFSSGRDEMILVYEYASLGSLDGHLKDVSFSWTQRIKVCLDAAKGLSYLHDPRETYQRLIHCDIKSANILLDENFKAKVSDFGLSKIAPANQKNSILVTGALGTLGYCDPLFMETYSLTKESDVYSFGVVLFEVLCGKLCFEVSSNGQLKILVPMWKRSYEQKQLSGIVFQGLTEQMNPTSLEIFADIAYHCLKRLREQRPAMSLVVEKLQESLALQEGRASVHPFTVIGTNNIFRGAKWKTSLKLAMARIELVRNKKGAQVIQMKKELAQLLAAGDDRTARIRVEHVIKEENMIGAYELIKIYCELLVARLSIIESQKTCPIDLKEAITSLIYAAPRCSDIPELVNVKKHFIEKYGKEFVTAATNMTPDCGDINRMLVEKLSAVAPNIQTKVKVLSDIAKEYNVNWEATSFEESKPRDDLTGPRTSSRRTQ